MRTDGEKLWLHDGRIAFWCPGCEGLHEIAAAGPSSWTFDGDLEWPTFSPSVLVTYNGPDADSRRDDGRRAPSARCHSFVRKGVIDFLLDCTHELRGQKIPLPCLP